MGRRASTTSTVSSSPRPRTEPPAPPFLLLDPARLPVILWLPNVIGYVRIATLIAAMRAADPTSEFALNMLVVSFALDYFDGPAARAFNMCSQFGDVLDHVTDHVTMTWLVWLTSASPYNVNFCISAAANAIAILYMCFHGHYFKHSAKPNFVQRTIEENNFWNLPSLLWAANTIIIPGARAGGALLGARRLPPLCALRAPPPSLFTSHQALFSRRVSCRRESNNASSRFNRRPRRVRHCRVHGRMPFIAASYSGASYSGYCGRQWEALRRRRWKGRQTGVARMLLVGGRAMGVRKGAQQSYFDSRFFVKDGQLRVAPPNDPFLYGRGGVCHECSDLERRSRLETTVLAARGTSSRETGKSNGS